MGLNEPNPWFLVPGPPGWRGGQTCYLSGGKQRDNAGLFGSIATVGTSGDLVHSGVNMFWTQTGSSPVLSAPPCVNRGHPNNCAFLPCPHLHFLTSSCRTGFQTYVSDSRDPEKPPCVAMTPEVSTDLSGPVPPAPAPPRPALMAASRHAAHKE